MSFLQSCALSSSLLLHALFMSPIRDHNVASTIFWQDNQKMPVRWEGDTVQYTIPVEIQTFVFHVSYMCDNSTAQWMH